MNSANLLHSKITPAHPAKLAYVYLRQSSPGQVQHNTESTTRQYALVKRALALGWPKDRVRMSDEDLGCSGTSTDLRSGFQPLPSRRLATYARSPDSASRFCSMRHRTPVGSTITRSFGPRLPGR